MSKLATVSNLIRLTYKKTQQTGDSFVAAVFRMLKLLTIGKFAPKELLSCAFHLPSQTKEMPLIISKENSLARLYRYNDPKKADLTENKDVFYKICRENDIRVPRHLLTARPGDQDLDRLNDMLSQENGEQHVYDYFPNNFVKKDLAGAYASGFEMFNKDNGKFKSHNGRTFNSSELIDYFTQPSNNQCVVQERIYCHADIAEFTGTRVAQCTRMGTIFIGTDEPRVGWFQLKVISSGNITDNYHGGLVGNMYAFGDLETGILEAAVTGDEIGMGKKIIHHHPDTGLPIKGFQIPNWQETKELACKAHAALPEFGVIGWDIAIAEKGPVILEGNIWTDPPLLTPHVIKLDDWKLMFG